MLAWIRTCIIRRRLEARTASSSIERRAAINTQFIMYTAVLFMQDTMAYTIGVYPEASFISTFTPSDESRRWARKNKKKTGKIRRPSPAYYAAVRLYRCTTRSLTVVLTFDLLRQKVTHRWLGSSATFTPIIWFLRATAATTVARLSHRNSACPSVHLSVTRVDQWKMMQARITKSSPSAAWKTLVSETVVPRLQDPANFQQINQNARANYWTSAESLLDVCCYML